MGNISVVTCTIPAGETVSDPVAIPVPAAPVLIIMPPDWHPTTGMAVISFQISLDGTDFIDTYTEDGHEVTAPVVDGGGLVVSTLNLQWVPYLRLRSGSYSDPVPVEADRTFQIVCA